MSDNETDDDYDDDDDFDDDGDNTEQAALAADVLDFVARSIVDDDESLEVEIDDSRDPIRLNVHANPDDLGRLIGKRGRVAGAIRTVVRAAASRDDITVDVEFVE